MVKKIEWSKTALVELNQMLTYLQDEVSENAADKFADLVKLKLSQLAANTFDGRPVPTRTNIRFILLGKYRRLYYRRHGLILYITRFYDTRQDPSKRPY
jgi:plasmid stabilization system protein ParE